MSKKEENVLKQFDLVVNYDIDYSGVAEGNKDFDADLEYAKLSLNYIQVAIMTAHKEGLNSQFRRIYAGIESKLEKAIKDKNYLVAFTTTELDFIRQAFASDKSKIAPALAKYVVKLEDALSTV